MASTKRRDFICPWKPCGKAFHRNSDLRRHYRIHTNERPYRCSVQDCNKSFIQRSALTVHLRTHTGEKPFTCTHEGCYKAFSDSSSLARHRRIHTGERSYKCQEPKCKRSFCRKTTLTNHQRRHHEPESEKHKMSEFTSPGQSYVAPINNLHPQNDQNLFLQQGYYPSIATATYGFNSHRNLSMSPVTAPEQPPVVANNSPVASFLTMQYAFGLYMDPEAAAFQFFTSNGIPYQFSTIANLR